MICYVAPHECTDFNHMIRAEIIEDFYKWGNAQFEEFILSVSELYLLISELNGLKSLEDDWIS